jgi:hypothetical protein
MTGYSFKLLSVSLDKKPASSETPTEAKFAIASSGNFIAGVYEAAGSSL